jgi:hypothetical protein
MRRRHVVLAALVLAVLGGALAIPELTGPARSAAASAQWLGSGSQPSPGGSAAVPTPSATTEAPVPVPTVTAPAGTNFFGWALLNRHTGKITGSANMATDTNTTESMIKVWIVSDYLRNLPAGQQPDATTMNELAAAIIHSDDDTAEKYYRAGGGNAVVSRMISICGLTDTTLTDGWWSLTHMTPRDAVRMGECVADGRAAGATWTPWVLQEMRDVQGTVEDQMETSGGGRWGVIDGLPDSLASNLAIKNGWTPTNSDGLWHVNNLAISDNWVLVVMVRYPIASGLQYGADVCSAVAQQLVPYLRSQQP